MNPAAVLRVAAIALCLLACNTASHAQSADIGFVRKPTGEERTSIVYTNAKGAINIGTVNTLTSGFIENLPVPGLSGKTNAIAVGGDFAAIAREDEILVLSIPATDIIYRIAHTAAAKTVTDLSISPNGDHLVTMTSATLLLYETERETPVATILAGGAAFTALDASDDWLAVGMSDGSLRIYHLQSASLYATVKPMPSAVTAVRIGNSADIIAVGFADGAVNLLDARGGVPIGRIKATGKPVKRISISSEASVLAYQLEGEKIKIADGMSGAALGELPTDPANIVAIQADFETGIAVLDTKETLTLYGGLTAEVQASIPLK